MVMEARHTSAALLNGSVLYDRSAGGRGLAAVKEDLDVVYCADTCSRPTRQITSEPSGIAAAAAAGRTQWNRC